MNGAPGVISKDLEQLAGAIAGSPAGPAAAGAAPAAAPPPGSGPAAPATATAINWRLEARELWQIVAMLSIRWPSLEAVYTEPVLDRLADVWAPVLERHNLDLGKFMIYIMAGTATLPVLGDSFKAIRADRLEAASRPAPLPVPAAPAAAAPAHAPRPPIDTNQPLGPAAPSDNTKLHEKA